MKDAKLPERIMIDCSHGNSEKKHENQIKVVDSLVQQLSDGTAKSWAIVGTMLESNHVEGEYARNDAVTLAALAYADPYFLEPGKQSIPATGPATLKYGQSVTDACINWDTTVER